MKVKPLKESLKKQLEVLSQQLDFSSQSNNEVLEHENYNLVASLVNQTTDAIGLKVDENDSNPETLDGEVAIFPVANKSIKILQKLQ